MFRRAFAAGLVCVLVTAIAATARTPQDPPVKLSIVILEGEGAINNIRQRTAREPIVQVEDENHKPIAGAVVLFSLPDRGASGVFANGQTSMAVTTDAQGRAVATGLRPNNVSGQFQVRVDASYQGQKASIGISQTNTLTAAVAAGAAGGITAKTIAIIVAVAGGAAAGGAVAATRGGKSSTPSGSSSPALTLTIGGPTVSRPPQ